MSTTWTCALALSLLFAGALSAQEPDRAGHETTEFRLLLRADKFYGATTGDSGSESRPVIALRMILSRPKAEAKALLLRLISEAEAGGQLYGLCGLYTLDRALFDEKVKPFLSDTREIDFCSVGCDVNLSKVRDAVRSPSRWAVRLPRHWVRPDWSAWVEAQSWPSYASARADIFGGAFPAELTRHPGFLAPRSPEGTLAGWLKKLGAEGADPEEIGSALARFGEPGLRAAQGLVLSKDPLARRAGVEVISSMRNRALGPASEDAAQLVAPLLLDPDDQVARASVRALCLLSPWNRAAKPYALKALNGLAERIGDKPSEALIEYAEDMLGYLAMDVGEEAVPALGTVLSVSNADLRCTAACVLQNFGAGAVAVSPALLQALGRGDTYCALETLKVIGVKPGSPEIHTLLGVLRGDRFLASAISRGFNERIASPVKAAELEAEAVEEGFYAALQILGRLGPRAGSRVRREIQLALQEHQGDSARIAELRLAWWRISGTSEGLAECLVAEYDWEELLKVIRKSPNVLPQLEPILRRGGEDGELALGVLCALGPKAQVLGPVLREVVAGIPLGDPRAWRAGRSLYEVCGDSSYFVRYVAWALEHDTDDALRSFPGMKHWSLALPLLGRLKQIVTGSKGDTRESALRALSRFGPLAEADLVPYFERLHGSEEFASLVPHLLGSLAKDGSRLALAALRRIVESQGKREKPTYAQLELDEVWRADE